MDRGHYDMEYFYNQSDYYKTEQALPVRMNNDYAKHKFDFYQFSFENGVNAYLFDSLAESQSFVQYMGFEENCIHCDKVENCLDRVVLESVKRNSNDFVEICKQLDETKTYLVIYCPFTLDHKKENPFL